MCSIRALELLCTLIYLLILAQCKSFTYLFSSLLIYFLKNRPVPFPGLRSYDVTKSGFSFFVFILYVIVYFVTDACLLLLCKIQFFGTVPRDWPGRTYMIFWNCELLCGNVLLFVVTEGVDQELLDSMLMPTDSSPVSLLAVCCLVSHKSLIVM